MRRTQHIELDELARSTVTIGLSPLPTLLAYVAAAIAKDGSKSSSPLSAAICARLRARDAVVLAPLASGWPREVCPVTPGATIAEELDRVAAQDATALAAKTVVAESMGRPTEAWHQVRRAPARWLPRYAEALARAWPVVEPLWSASSALLDREVERCSVAAARGAIQQLVPGLHAASRVIGDAWHLPSHSTTCGRLSAAATLQLVPLVVPAAMEGWSDDEDDRLAGVSYSAPRWWTAVDRAERTPRPESLTALLGPQRAKLLIGLDVPKPAGALAELLFTVPSAVTHHVQALEAAGLVERAPEGRQVIVSRTARGDRLLDLYLG